ncbi:MAG: MFS transporter [Clostridia bacterium]|nr:MFS transporter [Clostridia bacterium]
MVSVTLLTLIYVSFISLGLPDALLGSAWPSMLGELAVPVWGAGFVQMTASLCTIISSLNSARLIRRFGTGRLTALSTGLTALALLGYSFAPGYWCLLLMAVPLGLGAGAVDAGINNYVAQHCEPRHMNWLHCFWGVGTVLSPLMLSAALSAGLVWRWGYRIVFALQMTLCIVMLLTLRLWKQGSIEQEEKNAKVLSVRQVLALPGAKAGMTTFFCYCAAESTLLLWAPTFMVMTRGISPERAASFGSLFCIGITLGRAVSGFMTTRFTPRQMVRIGHAGMAFGVLMMFLPVDSLALAGVVVAGLGCAPVYPNIMQDTPVNYGAENSQAAVGVQMAFAYCGSLFVPTIFAFFADIAGYGLMPPFLLALVAVMAVLFNMQAKIVDEKNK